MNKTLPLMMIAFALVAVAATPTASACQYYGPAAETVNYVLPCAGFEAGNDALTLVDAIVDAVVAFVTGIPLP
jgi:hypothetical protein